MYHDPEEVFKPVDPEITTIIADNDIFLHADKSCETLNSIRTKKEKEWKFKNDRM